MNYWKWMESEKDRRRHQRLPLRLGIQCQKVGLGGGQIYTGNTVNVCPGGVLIEVNGGDFIDGQLLSIEMSVPPANGLIDFGGRFTSYARVLRTERLSSQQQQKLGHLFQKIALEFCESPKLRF